MATDWTAIIPEVQRLLKSSDFVEADISAALDVDAIEMRYLSLTSLPSYTTGGVLESKDFVAPDIYKNWSSDTFFTTDNYAEATPDTIDYVNGRFSFTADHDDGLKGSGFSADPYMAAARLLESRAAQMSEDLQSFSTQNGSFAYASTSSSLTKQAAVYRGLARVISTQIYRADVNVF